MNNIKRKGIDIDTAFSTASKRLEYKKATIKNFDGFANLSNSSNSHSLLRKMAVLGYRRALPLIKPVFIRLRQYFTNLIHSELESIKVLVKKQHTEASIRQAEIDARLSSIEAFLKEQHAEVTIRHAEIDARLSRVETYSLAAARRVAISCGPGEIMIKTEVGYVLCAATDHALLACLLEAGELEPGTRILIQQLIKPGDVYIDVGANIGMHALAAAQAMQGNGKVIAFEPFEPTKRLLEKTMWLNGHFEVSVIYQAAVSNKSGFQKLNLGATSGHHSLLELDTPEFLASGSVQVPIMTLDEVIAPNQKVDLIKIDAEGAEINVIEGAAALIKRNPCISLIVEFGPSHLKRAGFTAESWLGKFMDLGLSYRAIHPFTGKLEDLSIEELKNTESVNLLFSKTNNFKTTGARHDR